MIIYLIEQA